ncbi:hypothetical protein DDW44_01130 [Streptomyces tirandamycinicus]|uniref:Uncharacterized protein n=2 Tax=Streptomyces tirandamycinicus TaxID=2174846 RepID=A0A2S1SMB7_9ACTN|nr:hypothetical protein DDW44_01130 [Streptomyces tirandamycinicus]
MSGPMALEPDGGQGDTLALRLAAPGTTLALRLAAPGTTPSPRLAAPDTTLALRLPRRRRTPDDPVDVLAAELADRIGPAVHAYEVAALLESEGLTGEQIRERYGHPDLFSLAADLYRRVPRSFPEPPRGPDPWAPDHVRCALRGALFALPGLAHLLTGGMWHSPRGVYALVTAGLLSWAWGQALSHRAYLRLAAGPREAGRTLLVGAPTGALLASAAALAVAGPGPAALFGAGQSLYLAAAGVLLVRGRERLLLGTLVPLAAGAAVLPWWDPGPLPRIALPALTVVLAVAAAGREVRGMLGAPAGYGATRPPLPASVPYGLFGLAAGALVVSVGRQQPWAVVVLTVSMGPAEWLLYRFRGLSVAALRASADEAGFLLRSARTLALCLGGYLLPLVPAALLTGAEPAPLLALAAVLWTALLLQAFGRAWLPAAVTAAAAAGVVAATLLCGPPGTPWPLVCCGTAAGVLLIGALRYLGRPTAHS